MRTKSLCQMRLARFLAGLAGRRDCHAGSHRQRAGLVLAGPACNFNETQIAAAVILAAALCRRWQIGVRAKRRDIDAGRCRRIEHRRAFRRIDLLAIDSETDRRAKVGHPGRPAGLPPLDLGCLYGFHLLSSYLLKLCGKDFNIYHRDTEAQRKHRENHFLRFSL